MVISALVNFARFITEVFSVTPSTLSDAQLLRATRRARYAKKAADAADKALGTEIRERLAVHSVEDATGGAKLIQVSYKTYNVDEAVKVLAANKVPFAQVLSVTNKAVEALPADILALIPYVEQPGDRLTITGKGMDERE